MLLQVRAASENYITGCYDHIDVEEDGDSDSDVICLDEERLQNLNTESLPCPHEHLPPRVELLPTRTKARRRARWRARWRARRRRKEKREGKMKMKTRIINEDGMK